MFDAEKWQSVIIKEYGRAAVVLVESANDYAARNPGVPDFYRNLSVYFQQLRRIPTELRAMHADPAARDLLFELITHSRFGFDIVCSNHRWFWGIVQHREFLQIWGRQELYNACKQSLSLIKHYQSRIDALVAFHQYHTLRILLGDISSNIELESIVAELSDLTDVVTELAIELAVEKYADRYGYAQTGFVILGMGKLGGRELNYSSDIDLIFIYGENGSTRDGDDSYDHHSYFKKLGAEVIRILDERHAYGRLYRVDMRLRPEGASGELVLSYDETINYYYSAGRHWERQAMIKARPIAGDLQLGLRFLKDLAPWVYSPRVHYDKVGEARSMRQQIEQRAQDEDLKAGVGGIRDIEFLVQYLQLLYGGRYQDLRSQTTISALRRIMQHGLLPATEVNELIEHYTWLRMAEHRLQMFESRQLHEIPTDESSLLFLAHRCGFEGAQAAEHFQSHLAMVRSRVRALADEHYLRNNEEKDALIALILDKEPPTELVDQILDPIQFNNKNRALKQIRSLAHERFFILSRAKTESLLIDILPSILVLLQSSPEPDETLHNFTKIVSAVGGKCYFYEMLQNDPELLITTMTFAGWANFLIDKLISFTGLVDDIFEVLDPNDLYIPQVRQEAMELIQGLNDPAPSLSYLQARELSRIAIHDLRGVDHITVCKSLSSLAADIVAAAFEFCAQRMADRWGWPLENGKPTRCAILGLGKLGSGELAYASDVDVIYVCDKGGLCPDKDRDGEAFWTRVVMDLSKLLDGIYEVDPRLRPWGDQGQLVITLNALEQYWSQQRDLWERLAMTRVSVICGDDELGQEAVECILNQATDCVLPESAADELMSMRLRMEDSVQGRDHLKRGVGGYVDVEFIAQFLSLRCLKGQLPAGMAIKDCLQYLAEQQCLEQNDADNLIESLRILRGIEARMRLSAGKAISSIPTKEHERLALARRCGYPDVDTLNRKVAWARDTTRPLFNKLIV